MMNVTYIISNINKAIAFEWIVEEIDKSKFDLSFILLNNEDSYLEDYLIKSNIKVYRVNYVSKKNIPAAIFKICKFLIDNKTDIVHTHLFDASFCGLMAAKICGIKKRIYTRHYSSYHHEYFPKAVKWDKVINWLATKIIAISSTVKEVLIAKESVPPEKIVTIYHGFKLNDFIQIKADKLNELSNKYNPFAKKPVIGVISRFTELKGIQFIIPSFKMLLKNHPDALLVLFNASGDYEKKINELLKDLPESSYCKVVFENDITSVYHLFDVFVHVPINKTIEAFGQIYVECMASNIPLVATKSGIGNEILINRENSIIVPYNDSVAIYEGINLLLKDEQLKKQITANALNTVSEKFQLKDMIEKLERLYLR